LVSQEELSNLRINLIWAVYGGTLFSIVLAIAIYQYQWFYKRGAFIPEQLSVQVAMLLIKTLITIQPGGKATTTFIYPACLLVQLICFARLLETDEKQQEGKERRMQSGHNAKFRMFVIVQIVYFTAMQYYYRSSHRERFSSLQFGKVCPGTEFCDLDLEWLIVIVDVYGAHLFCLLMLPMFTIDYRKTKYLTFSQMQNRHVKKYKEQQDKEEIDKIKGPVRRRKQEEKGLYDAD